MGGRKKEKKRKASFFYEIRSERQSWKLVSYFLYGLTIKTQSRTCLDQQEAKNRNGEIHSCFFSIFWLFCLVCFLCNEVSGVFSFSVVLSERETEVVRESLEERIIRTNYV